MKKWLIVAITFILLGLVQANAAWTDKYVAADAAGGGDGSVATPWTIEEAIADAATPHAGYRYNVKAGSYPNMGADYAFSGAGTTTAPIWWRGYKASIGDKDTAGGTRVPGTDLPLFNGDTATDQIVVSGAHQIFSNIAVTSVCTDAGGAVNLTGGNIKLIRCQVENTAANANSRAITTGTANTVVLIGCRLKGTTSTYTIAIGIATHLLGCHLIGGDSTVYVSGGPAIFNYCIIEGFATSGVNTSTASNSIFLSNCTIYAAATNDVLVGSLPTTGQVTIINSILGGCTNGINSSVSGTNGVTVFRTHFYNCGTDLVNITEMATVAADLGVACLLMENDTDPFVAKASSNYTLISTAVDASAGYPGLFEGQTVMTGYPDIGAVRHVDPSSSGGKFISYLLGEPIRPETEFVARLFGVR